MRRERDVLGTREVPDQVYYGVETIRALENFPVSGIREQTEFIQSFILVKKAAALTNMELGVLDVEKGKAIVKATDEVLQGQFADQFPVDVFQSGAGTSSHMNVNEVLANRALELLGRKKGDYDFLSPHDHVNKSQSTNDTFPTASHLAIIVMADRLIPILEDLTKALYRKGEEFCTVPKSGRTHLMDALPVMLGDEFLAYGCAIARAARRIQEQKNNLLEIAIGGTATGTGANTPLGFRDRIIHYLSQLTSLPLRPAQNSFEALQSRSQMVSFSGSLRELSLELIRIANDLRMMGSGPTAGINEIALPSVQPGSSIMPGKVNPVMAECLDMICYQIIGNDTAVNSAAQAGQLELNVMTPVMTHNILESLRYLTNFLPVFQKRCIEGISAHEAHMQSTIEKNPFLITLLAPRIGYLQAAILAEEALKRNTLISILVVEKGIMTETEAKK
ncbi:MAG: aspartate ammonia-lyase, partial [Methanomicrobiales archaeon]|nr:aspartate ammonia-lyase [Methanomicrobiales archaeon]